MKNPESPKLDALEALLAEKRKHEGYLAKLEERRAGTPERVFARLRDEYMTRLTDAQVRAHAEAEALVSVLEVDQAAVAEIEARLAVLEDERVEGELREAVGELDSKEWQRRLVALNASISTAEKERDALASAAQRVRILLAEARGDSALPLESARIAEPVSAKPAPRASAAAPITNAPSFDELAFLDSVVGRPSSPAAPATVPGPVAPRQSFGEPLPVAPATSPPLPPGPPPAPRGSVPVPSFAEAASVAEQASVPMPEAVRSSELALEPPVVPVPDIPAIEEPTASAPPVAASTAPVPEELEPIGPEDEEPPSALGRATSRNTQSIKTLKCSECGSMNYPTEWYCERCGGELAAL
jgi:hypothetical protein